jgi:two-component system phosphate regulon sensor histidine kinase PhoR
LFQSIQWRITIWFVLLVIVIMSILGAYLTSSVRGKQLDNLCTQLENEARITAEASRPIFSGEEAGNDLDALAKQLGNQIDTRITIIALDGTVLGDSVEDPKMMENHATRPEIQDALASGIGESTRYSTTLGEKMMYVAVPITDHDEIIGITRVALPLTQVQSSVNTVIVIIIIAIAIAVILVVLAAWFITRVTTRPIRELTRASREIASGEFGRTISVSTKDESGQLAHAFSEMSSKLKEMLAAISDDKARLAGILDNMADGVLLTDTEGDIVLTNNAARTLLNIGVKDTEGKPLIEVVREFEFNEILNTCLKTGKEQIAQFEAGISKRFLRVIAIPYANNRPGGALLLIQDLTEVRSLQTMRRELVGNISHEFRTPLAGIKTMVETLQDIAAEDKEATKDFLSRIEVEVDRMTQLVAELTELSRIETGKAELELEPVEVNSLVEEAVAQLKPQAERQNLSVETSLARDFPAIPADRERLRQVMVNLIHNAIKFNHPGGNIKITTKSSEKMVTVEVSDTGIGIAKNDLPHIFERFYKADKSRSGQGSGIGLAIAKHVIESHGGEIKARSEEGKGTTFSISLPLASRE